jgi:hypothetical protein
MSTAKVYTTLEKSLMIAGLLIVVFTIAALLVYSVNISNTGTIITIGVDVYSDSAGTNRLTSVNWGFLRPGDNATLTVWIKNTQTANVTLNMTASNWSPATAANYLTMSWNYTTGYVLRSSEMIPVNLKLSVAQNITGINSFNFTITIIATEYPST